MADADGCVNIGVDGAPEDITVVRQHIISVPTTSASNVPLCQPIFDPKVMTVHIAEI